VAALEPPAVCLLLAACTGAEDEAPPQKRSSITETSSSVSGDTGLGSTTADTGCLDQDQDGSCVAADCDDADPTTFPGALDPEADGFDTDCDGKDGDFVREMDEGGVWLPELATGEAGHALIAGPDVDGDGLPDVLVGAPVYLTYPYVYEAVYGYVTVLDQDAEPLGSWVGRPFIRAGTTLATGGDLDGDGRDDDVVVVGWGEDHEGRAWVVPAPALQGSGELHELAVAEVRGFNNEYINETSGVSPDLTGDGFADLLLHVRQSLDTDLRLYPGPLPPLQSVDDASIVLVSEEENDTAGGRLVTGADLDADGLADLAVGAMSGNGGMGVLYVLPAPLSGSGNLEDAPVILLGSGESGEAGYGLSGAGDTDGDGYEELLVGAALDSREGERGGRAFLVPATASGGLDDLSWATFVPDRGHRFLGASLARGDLDGDGRDELLIGAPDDWYFAEGPGEVWIYRQPVEGTLSRLDAWRVLQGASLGDVAGAALAVADLDGDGRDDVALGAPGDDEAGLNAGKVYLVMGASLDP
jgi:hypothetical protein